MDLQVAHLNALSIAVRRGGYSSASKCQIALTGPDKVTYATEIDLLSWGYITASGRLTQKGFEIGCKLNG